MYGTHANWNDRKPPNPGDSNLTPEDMRQHSARLFEHFLTAFCEGHHEESTFRIPMLDPWVRRYGTAIAKLGDAWVGAHREVLEALLAKDQKGDLPVANAIFERVVVAAEVAQRVQTRGVDEVRVALRTPEGAARLGINIPEDRPVLTERISFGKLRSVGTLVKEETLP